MENWSVGAAGRPAWGLVGHVGTSRPHVAAARKGRASIVDGMCALARPVAVAAVLAAALAVFPVARAQLPAAAESLADADRLWAERALDAKGGEASAREPRRWSRRAGRRPISIPAPSSPAGG